MQHLGGGPVGQVSVPGGLAVQGNSIVADGRYRIQQTVLHIPDQGYEQPDAVTALVFRLAREITVRNGLQVRADFCHRAYEMYQQIAVAECQLRRDEDNFKPVTAARTGALSAASCSVRFSSRSRAAAG